MVLKDAVLGLGVLSRSFACGLERWLLTTDRSSRGREFKSQQPHKSKKRETTPQSSSDLHICARCTCSPNTQVNTIKRHKQTQLKLGHRTLSE